jgi:site-specific DNA recombinase
MKCVIYCRVSTKMQANDEIPIEGQIDECRRYAREKGWEVVKVYQDAGYSGGTDERPAFQEMYAAARDNKPSPFDIVLTWRSNRLFRSIEHRLAYSRLFRRYGVKLVSLHEPEFEGSSGRFLETMLAAADEMYRSQISEDTLRGLKQVAKRGYSTGGRPPVGYRNVRAATGRIRPNGEPEAYYLGA